MLRSYLENVNSWTDISFYSNFDNNIRMKNSVILNTSLYTVLTCINDVTIFSNYIKQQWGFKGDWNEGKLWWNEWFNL